MDKKCRYILYLNLIMWGFMILSNFIAWFLMGRALLQTSLPVCEGVWF